MTTPPATASTQLCRGWSTDRLSRMMLGTVQFGLPYGIANAVGQPGFRDVLEMVATAVAGGVNCFDTAAAYGSSEEVLGRALHELQLMEQVLVVTKVRPLSPTELASPQLAITAIRQSVDDSRRRLGLDCLPLVLFHREEDAVFQPVLDDLRQRGWLQAIGVSCDQRPGPAGRFAAADVFQALQLPCSILDQRHQRSGVFQMARAHGVALFARSIFLQGLLLMPESRIPAALSSVIPVRRQLTALADQAGMPLAELALRYMLSHPEITCVLTGVETVEQVRSNLTVFARGPLPADLLAAVRTLHSDLPDTVLTPRLWPALQSPTPGPVAADSHPRSEPG